MSYKNSHIPVKDTKYIYMQTMCIDIVRLCKVKLRNRKELKFYSLSIINLATNFLELHSIPDKFFYTVICKVSSQ